MCLEMMNAYMRGVVHPLHFCLCISAFIKGGRRGLYSTRGLCCLVSVFDSHAAPCLSAMFGKKSHRFYCASAFYLRWLTVKELPARQEGRWARLLTKYERRRRYAKSLGMHSLMECKVTMKVFLTSGKKISNGVSCSTLPGNPPGVSYTFVRTAFSSDFCKCRV